MIKVLVTGGAGFIGTNLIEKLVDKKYEITVIDNLSYGDINNLEGFKDKINFIQHDVCDYDFVHKILDENFDYIYCLAAVASVADSVRRPYQTHLVNQEAIINMLEYLRINHLKPNKFVFTSSAAVYGNYPESPKLEDGRVHPITPYAIDKYATERFVLSYGNLYNIPTVAVRLFNVFGPFQRADSDYSGVLSIIADCLLNNRTFTIFGDGEQTRDFVYVKDVVNALVYIAENVESRDVYNIGYGKSITLNNVVEKLEQISGRKINISYQESRKGDITKSLADITRLKNLGYKAKWGFEKGLSEYWKSKNEKSQY